MVRENITFVAEESPYYCKLKQQKPWFEERCSKPSDQRKQAELQWLHDPS
jgi:hypothetical protein